VIPLGVANSSPFIGLDRIGRLDIMGALFARLIVPEAVAREVGDLPAWACVQPFSQPPLLRAFPPRIHPGEAAVILLGLEHPGAVLVLDDWYAREFAFSRQLPVIGTVGLLLRAKAQGLVPEVSALLDQLQGAGFRIAPRVVADAKRLAREAQ